MQSTRFSTQQPVQLPKKFKPHEYVIYAYDIFDENTVGTNKWQRITSEQQKKDAFLTAENLISSTDYQFIEIKKAKTEAKTGKTSMITIKTYNSTDQKRGIDAQTIGWFCALFTIGAAIGLATMI